MRANVVSIGSELLAGITADSNFVFLARALAAIGIPIVRHLTVGDQRVPMLEALRLAAGDCELVVVSGGLGPTPDDRTREVLAEFSGARLTEDAEVANQLEARYARFGRPFTRAARGQAVLPEGWERLPNPVGLAPGLWLERGGVIVCALPGVPREFEAIVNGSLVPRLAARTGGGPLPSVILHTMGIPESELSARIESKGIDLAGVELASLPNAGGVDLRIVGQVGNPQSGESVARVAGALGDLLGEAIFGRDEETIEGVLRDLLRVRGLRLALAESCTGGLVGHRVTRVAGSSEVFAGGVVAYANAAKESLLGVAPGLLAEHGAVSAEVALAMARGALTRFAADVALAVTGIAGPGGGTEEKPVGLVFIGLAAAGGHEESRQYLLPGDRHQVRERAASLALGCLWRFLLRMSPS